jgi:hypothetical protein
LGPETIGSRSSPPSECRSRSGAGPVQAPGSQQSHGPGRRQSRRRLRGGHRQQSRRGAFLHRPIPGSVASAFRRAQIHQQASPRRSRKHLLVCRERSSPTLVVSPVWIRMLLQTFRGTALARDRVGLVSRCLCRDFQTGSGPSQDEHLDRRT